MRRALERVADGDGRASRARIEKRIPVAAGLGGGSSDAATALRLANELREEPLDDGELHEACACELGADVPYFLQDGPAARHGRRHRARRRSTCRRTTGSSSSCRDSAAKASTADVYAAFDARGGEDGYDERRAALVAALEQVRRPRDLAALPPNDLASSPLADELQALGAFRADVTGAGPAVYGLFLHGEQARAAQRQMSAEGRTWLTAPAWYR